MRWSASIQRLWLVRLKSAVCRRWSSLVLNTNRDPPPQDEEGAAGCEASEPAQQAGAGGPQHLPRPQRPGAAGNPPADRDEAGQVSRSVWTHISLPSAPHPTPPSSSAPCMFVSSLNITVVYTLSVEHITKAFTVDAKPHKGFGILAISSLYWPLYMKTDDPVLLCSIRSGSSGVGFGLCTGTVVPNQTCFSVRTGWIWWGCTQIRIFWLGTSSRLFFIKPHLKLWEILYITQARYSTVHNASVLHLWCQNIHTVKEMESAHPGHSSVIALLTGRPEGRGVVRACGPKAV